MAPFSVFLLVNKKAKRALGCAFVAVGLHCGSYLFDVCGCGYLDVPIVVLDPFFEHG
ncbi:hypothetical protein SLEP1_g16337 [Rubroshorea leprosula]|uniref:Uncharacterized protein n=1 Tax=Rubroshorea leprosula TaxID=152421 RepID=A0AAV5IWD1_9ROSI|nr:hypothetical protein SLEP1_g16337 [Rubroshorea leprosula]